MFWAICGDDDRQYIHSFFVETTSRNYIINTNGDILGSFTKEVLINHDSFFTNGVLIYRAHLRQFVDFSGKSFVCVDHIGKVISWKRRAFYFVVKRNGKWGLIDINNRDIVPCQFDTYNLKEEGSDPDLPECCHHPLDSYFEIVFKSKDENLERAVATIYRLYYGALIQHQKYSEGMERNPFYTNGYDGEPFLVPYKEYRNEKVVFDDAMGHLRVIPIEELSGDYLLNHCLKPVFKKESE